MTNYVKNFIPEQLEGERNDVEYHLDFPSQGEAHRLYMLAKNKLKDIGNWGVLTGAASSDFVVTDKQGNKIYKIAEKGDVVSIDMPGPGSIVGKGHDWVRVEALDENENEWSETEFIVMTVRPVANPEKPESVTAHFYSHNSTNTFIVQRYGNRVSASVHGRNETPNTEGNIIDRARNAIVGLTGRHGLSDPHWRVFVENLLKSE